MHNNLAELYRETKSFSQALKHNNAALKIRLAALGPEHTLTAASYANLAKVLIDQQKYHEALPFIRRALDIDEKTQRPGHPYIRKNLKRLADVLNKLGETQEAARITARLNKMPAEGSRHLPLLYATSRALNLHGSEISYGTSNAKRLNFGRAIARVPDIEIKRQAVRRASAMGLLDAATGKLTRTDLLAVRSVQPAADFSPLAAEAKQVMKLGGLFANQALVFVHGYNTDFNEALLRAGQISFDLEFDGVILPFIWASKGTLGGYNHDQRRAAAAVPYLKTMIAALARELPGTKIHFIAHSMGNRVLLGALQELAADDIAWAKVFGKLRLGEVILAHPDVDAENFRAAATRLAKRKVRPTLYASKNDWALWASKLLLGRSRAGALNITAPGVDTIDISGMTAADKPWYGFGLNHAVFVRNPVLFGEITRLLLTGQRPVHERSPGFALVEKDGKQFWRYQPLNLTSR